MDVIHINYMTHRSST